MAKTGTQCPSAALSAMKKQNRRYTYLPHVGAKQRRKGQLRILKQLTEIPTADGVKRGFTGLQMLQKPELAAFVKAHPDMFTGCINMDAAVVVE